MRIEPAKLAFDADGTPFSAAYGDVYHSADSGPGQAEHVFLGGNGLPQRWADARVFTILETGFGLGLNFLAAWRRWREGPPRGGRLHFVSVEKHPFSREALAKLHARYGEFEPLAAALQASWPPLVPGLHRLHFDGGRVTLTLAFGDAADVLPKLRLAADAIFLDGFAPRCNPDMWNGRLLKAVARLARSGATAATYTTAAGVKEALAAAGFEVEKRPGFGRKRDMLVATHVPRHATVEAALPERHALVIGAGLAGAAMTERLVVRGWQVDCIAASRTPAPFAGVFRPHVSPDDALRSRLLRAGYLYSVSRWLAAGRALEGDRCGVLQVAEAWAEDKAAALGYPADYASFVSRAEAEAIAGCRLGAGGWWFPGGGWASLPGIAAAQMIEAPRAATVVSLEREGGAWRVLDAGGQVIAAAPVVVLANASDAARLAPIGRALERVRGQVTHVAAASLHPPRAVIAGSGYVTPSMGGVVTVGSTYDPDDDDPSVRQEGHRANLERLSRLLPDARDAQVTGGAVGFRSVVADRLPLVGALPDLDETRRRAGEFRGAHLADLPRRSGLYCVAGLGSRGLATAALAAEAVASLLEGEPLPLEGDLADALDPARFALKQARRGLV